MEHRSSRSDLKLNIVRNHNVSRLPNVFPRRSMRRHRCSERSVEFVPPKRVRRGDSDKFGEGYGSISGRDEGVALSGSRGGGGVVAVAIGSRIGGRELYGRNEFRCFDSNYAVNVSERGDGGVDSVGEIVGEDSSRYRARSSRSSSL